MSLIQNIKARQLFDSRGNPTLEAEIHLDNGIISTAIVPSGASTGEREACELRDADKKVFLGKGVLKAKENIEKIIFPLLKNKKIDDQNALDQAMIDADGSEQKNKLGANAILAVSLACARAAALDLKIPLFEYCGKLIQNKNYILPTPLMNVINGGAHANNGLKFQELMIVPTCGGSFNQAFRAGVETFHALKNILHDKHFSIAVGDEGGFAPDIKNEKEALDLLLQAIEKAGYRPGEDIYLALDVASSEFYSHQKYQFESSQKNESSASEMISYYESLCKKYPIVSIEDGLAESDWAGWKELTLKMGKNIQLVGDDLFCTNEKILKEGIENKVANAILIKVNQIGSLSETIASIDLANKNHYKSIISHRSGESEDSFIADLAVGVGAGQIKTGSASRSERMAKYNQLLRIEEYLGEKAQFLGQKAFK